AAARRSRCGAAESRGTPRSSLRQPFLQRCRRGPGREGARAASSLDRLAFVGFVDGPDHVKGLLRDVSKLVFEDPLAPLDRFFYGNVPPRLAREVFRRKERLSQKALEPAGA